jgi:pantoate--beta-alanine ligase
MEILDSIERVNTWRETVGGRLGLVPTMGALHDGHLSLVRRARPECDRVAATIFVNPAQFGAHEDLAQYPRDLPGDLALFEREGVDMVFTPTEAVIYPPGFSTWVTEERVARRWEGQARPGHFRGVTTVVLKLFTIVRPDRAYFGEKDYQQLRVVAKMVHDLNVPVTIVPCPTVREPDGLAMSSRNVRLAAADRKAATVLWRALDAARAAAAKGERDGDALRRGVEDAIGREPRARLDYVAVVDPQTLEPLERLDARGAVCLVAARFGDVRLIDNLRLV